MKVFVVVCTVLAVARGAAIYPAATQFIPAPQYDSAVIQSDRLGGNFAYSSLEAKAYAAVSPVVQNVLSPVGVSYTATPIQYPAVAYPAYSPAYAPAYTPAVAPIYPAAPAYTPALAPIYPAAPAAPAAPAGPAPIVEEAAPEAPAPSADSVEAAASSDDSVTIEAA